MDAGRKGAVADLALRLKVPRWWWTKRLTFLGLTIRHKKAGSRVFTCRSWRGVMRPNVACDAALAKRKRPLPHGEREA